MRGKKNMIKVYKKKNTQSKYEEDAIVLNNNFHRVLLSQTLLHTNNLTTTEMIYCGQTTPEESGQNNFSWHVPLERGRGPAAMTARSLNTILKLLPSSGH